VGKDIRDLVPGLVNGTDDLGSLLGIGVIRGEAQSSENSTAVNNPIILKDSDWRKLFAQYIRPRLDRLM